jgi:hypothetical protein
MIEFNYDCPICGNHKMTLREAIFCCATVEYVKEALNEEENEWVK